MSRCQDSSSAEMDLLITAAKPLTLSETMSAAHGFAGGDLHSMTAAKDQLFAAFQIAGQEGAGPVIAEAARICRRSGKLPLERRLPLQ
jgi:hypothetical protein